MDITKGGRVYIKGQVEGPTSFSSGPIYTPSIICETPTLTPTVIPVFSQRYVTGSFIIGDAALITDGDVISVFDGTTTYDFEFDNDSTLISPTAVAITFSGTETMEELQSLVFNALSSSISHMGLGMQANEILIISGPEGSTASSSSAGVYVGTPFDPVPAMETYYYTIKAYYGDSSYFIEDTAEISNYAPLTPGVDYNEISWSSPIGVSYYEVYRNNNYYGGGLFSASVLVTTEEVGSRPSHVLTDLGYNTTPENVPIPAASMTIGRGDFTQVSAAIIRSRAITLLNFSGTLTLDLNQYSVFEHVLASNVSNMTIVNNVWAQEFTLAIGGTVGGPYYVNWSSGFRWADGTVAPDLPANGHVLVITFRRLTTIAPSRWLATSVATYTI
jgi:hypothetical protein